MEITIFGKRYINDYPSAYIESEYNGTKHVFLYYLSYSKNRTPRYQSKMYLDR